MSNVRRFRRLVTRQGYEDIAHWRAGYEFSTEYHGRDDLVLDRSTGTIHLMETLEEI